jgi:hypothetical protein
MNAVTPMTTDGIEVERVECDRPFYIARWHGPWFNWHHGFGATEDAAVRDLNARWFEFRTDLPPWMQPERIAA